MDRLARSLPVFRSLSSCFNRRRHGAHLRLLLVALAAAVAAPHVALADSLSGRIRDPQGGVVAGAQLRLFDRTSGQIREAASAADGRYAFAGIPAGEYVIEAQGSGGSLSGATVVSVEGAQSLDVMLAVSGITAEVVVTASSTPLILQEVAKALDVIDADEIALRNELSVAEALRVLPGIRVQSLGGPGSRTTIQTRGLRSHDTAVLIDGMRFRDAASTQGDATGFLSNLTTVDTEQIEVMRGSGSSLYGSNAMAGVINVTSRTGGGPAHGDFLAEGGGLGMLRAVPSVRGGLAGDRLTYSGALSYINVADGIRGANPYRSVSPQGMLRYQFSPTLSATGRVWYSDDESRTRNSPEFPAEVLANFPAAGVVRAVPLPTDQLEPFEKGLPIDGGAATFVPSANDADALRRSSFLNGSAVLQHTVAPGATYRVAYQAVATEREHVNGPLGVGHQPFDENSSFFDGRTDMVQARLDATFGTSNFLSAGYEFEREQLFTAASGNIATITIDSYSHALYAQDRVELLDGRLQLSVGGRVQTFNLPEPTFVGGSHPYGAVDFEVPTAYTGDAAVAYFVPGSETKLRLHAGNSYRAPSPYERFGGSFSSFFDTFSFYGDPRLEPERAVSFDGGVDQWLFDSKLQLSATAFYTDLQEIIIFDFANFPAATDPFGRFSGYRNAGGGRARGVEVSAQAAPGISTNLRISYTYTDSESVTPTIGDDFYGVPGLSKHLFTLSATQWIADRLNVTFDLFAASDYLLSPYGALGRRMIFGGPVKGDLVVRYDLLARPDLGLDLYAKVENLLDHAYYEDGFLTPGAWAIGGLRVRY